MDSPKNIKIPKHWLINTGRTTYWPHKEGIWVDKETEPILRLVAVHLNLMDILAAKDQLTQCNDQFVNDFASELLSLFKPVMADARAGRKATTPVVTEADNDKIIAIYRPWVDAWALGSEKMLVWASGSNIPNILLDILKGSFSRKESRQLENRISGLGAKFSPPWVWKTLLSGEYRRLDQTRRELARRTIQSDGYYRKREKELLIHARYWIMFYILGYSETELSETFNIPLPSMSRMLKPFNEALLTPGQRPKSGRPDGAQTTDRAKEEQERTREEKLEKTATRMLRVSVPGWCPKCLNRLFNNECLMCGYHDYEN